MTINNLTKTIEISPSPSTVPVGIRVDTLGFEGIEDTINGTKYTFYSNGAIFLVKEYSRYLGNFRFEHLYPHVKWGDSVYVTIEFSYTNGTKETLRSNTLIITNKMIVAERNLANNDFSVQSFGFTGRDISRILVTQYDLIFNHLGEERKVTHIASGFLSSYTFPNADLRDANRVRIVGTYLGLISFDNLESNEIVIDLNNA